MGYFNSFSCILCTVTCHFDTFQDLMLWLQ